MTEDAYYKEFDAALTAVAQGFKQNLQAIRGNRPSPDIVQNVKVSLYDQTLSVRELGSLSVLPPRTIQIAVWDKNAVGAVMKAIDAAHLGLSTTNNGNNILATLSPLGNERREELIKVTKKTSEAARIQVRHHRDETIKKIKAAVGSKELTEDQVFRLKEKIQKLVDGVNGQIETMVQNKFNELGE